MHAFMERTAQRIREQTGHAHLTANDIDVKVTANLFAYKSIGDTIISHGEKAITARGAIMKMLEEFHK